MSTSTATREAGHSTSVLFSGGQIASGMSPTFSFKKGDNDNQVLVVSDVPVFRSGTFRDSMGFQTTWEAMHMDQMVSHFTLLRDRGVFSDIPIRDGHPGFLYAGGSKGEGRVVGWHTGIRAEKRTSLHDGKEYVYLIADFEIIDPEAQQAIRSGLWRNLSSEVGPYFTNDEAEFWPVYKGVAYVDIPAVEGLKGFSAAAAPNNTHLMMEEDSMTSSTVTPPAVPQAPVVPAPEAQAPAQQAPAQANHGQAAPTHSFSIGGATTSDYAKVQAHITELEAKNAAYAIADSERAQAAREDFCKGLSDQGKILATQLDSTSAFAKTLTDEQFTAWKASYEGAPAQPLLGAYSQNPGNVTPGDTAAGAADANVRTLREIVRNHSRSGMAPAKIKETSSYKQLVLADPSFVL